MAPAIHDDGDVIRVVNNDSSLTYSSRQVLLDDGTAVAHESCGGTLSSVWTTDLDGLYVEVLYLGDGPLGGELVMVVPDLHAVVVGDLYPDGVPAHVPPSWPVALDLALGLVDASSDIWTSRHTTVTRDDLDAAHQLLLGSLHGTL